VSARDDWPSIAHRADAVGSDEWDRHDEECGEALAEIDRLHRDLEHARLAFAAEPRCTPAERALIDAYLTVYRLLAADGVKCRHREVIAAELRLDDATEAVLAERGEA
jgi:hypothetical protein